MSTQTLLPAKPAVVYPESDGNPMAENTLQFQWIVTIEGGLDALFRNDPNVFVAGDLLWYPVEGNNTIRQAPDAMVAFGRSKGRRGSYRQWEEGNIAPQVVFEVLSPGNRFGELLRKFRFYEHYGVEEYYIYDPDNQDLTGHRLVGENLEEIPKMDGWVSPRLGIKFDLSAGELRIFAPDGSRFLTFVELAAQREQERLAKEQAKQQAEQAKQQVERLAAQLRALGVEPEM